MKRFFESYNLSLLFLFLPLTIVSACNRGDLEAEEVKGCTNPFSDNYNPQANSDDGSCTPFDCAKCTYTVPADAWRINGDELNLKGGDFICLDSQFNYGPLQFENLNGENGNPITIINCGGTVKIQRPTNASFLIKTIDSRHFRISGQGHPSAERGIILEGGNIALTLEYLSSNFEIDHIEILNTGYAGVMAKTDPSCDEKTVRGNFTMRNVSFHDIHTTNTGGEGLYVGNSFYTNGVDLSCGKKFPHDIIGVEIYNNVTKRSGREGIQLGCAIEGASVHDNVIEDYGNINMTFQDNGLQIGEGTGGLCYNNKIINGPGIGLIVLGLGDNVLFNNLIVNSGRNGVFCDERFTPGNGFAFINNTIINPGHDGITLYTDLVDMNTVINNVIINPGSFDIYENDNTSRTGMDSYIYKLNGNVKVDAKTNYFSRNIGDANFENPGSSNFAPKSGSPLIDAGTDVKSRGIDFDINNRSRPKGSAFDIGAYEFNQ
jgi:hypothetical protein